VSSTSINIPTLVVEFKQFFIEVLQLMLMKTVICLSWRLLLRLLEAFLAVFLIISSIPLLLLWFTGDRSM
jgi:hypothetical protein